jgi:hypothetical protein
VASGSTAARAVVPLEAHRRHYRAGRALLPPRLVEAVFVSGFTALAAAVASGSTAYKR